MKNSIPLEKVNFPVYRLGTEYPSIVDGEMSFEFEIHDPNTEDTQYLKAIVDDTRIPGDTLASRRLKLLARKENLFRLKIAIFFMSDLLKIATNKTWFIDSSGRLLRLAKTKRVRLVFDRIKKTIRIPSGGAIIELENYPGRYKSLFAPPEDCGFAGILLDGMKIYLYGYYRDKLDESFRYI